MTRPPRRIACLSLSTTALLILAGCGDDGGTTEQTGDTGGTTPTSVSATDGTASDPPTTGVSDSDGQTSNMSGTEGQTSMTDPTTGASMSTDTDSDTTAGTCMDGTLCAGDCCGADDLCDNGECVPDCGGPPPCGEAKVCCAGGDLCYLGECVTPGAACSELVCATRPDPSGCAEGFQCNAALSLCMPSKADPSCEYIPPPQTFAPRPVFTWGKRTKLACTKDAECQTAEVCTDQVCTPSWPHIVPDMSDVPTVVQSSSIPLVVDLDDDCVPEIVFNTYRDEVGLKSDGRLRAIRGDTGAKVWTVTDPAYDTNGSANPAVGDIDGDGIPEIIVEGEFDKNTNESTILAFNADGTPRWKSAKFTVAGASGSVAIANMDGEGNPEIVLGAAIYDNTGKLLFQGMSGKGTKTQGPISCIADLDGDMRPELIAGKTAYRTTGTVAGKNFAGQVYWDSMTGDGYCGVADFDDDGAPELVLVSVATVNLLDGQTGAVDGSIAIPSGGSGGPPNIADFDGDGTREIGVAGSFTYNVFLVDPIAKDLSLLWTAVTEDDSSQVTGSSVFDFDGDGRYEVVYNDERYIRIYPGTEPDCALNPPGPGCDKNMTDAEVLFRDRNSSRTRTEYPVIADVDGNFKADIVFPTNNDAPENQNNKIDSGIEVWRDALDNWVGTRPVWNQHTYHITNVGLRGEIPVVEADSWTAANNYRNNAQGANSYCAPDLVLADLDFEPNSCDVALELSVFVANQGCLGVGPGVLVAFYDQQDALIAQAATTGPLPAGAAEKVTAIAMGLTGMHNVRAIIDDDGMGGGSLNECAEDNNSTPLSPVCIPPG